jgi:Ca2+-binding EF-hand superfamily protein
MAQKDKIFTELEGVFKWIEYKRNEKGKSEILEVTSYHQIKEFFAFLNIEASNEEIEALNELANPDGNPSISYDELYKVFVQDEKSRE